MIALTVQSVSNGSPHLIRMPFSAHLPVHTINAVGVANPSAQGQAITITAEKYNNDAVNPTPITKNRMINTSNATPITIGTKTADIVSANH